MFKRIQSNKHKLTFARPSVFFFPAAYLSVCPSISVCLCISLPKDVYLPIFLSLIFFSISISVWSLFVCLSVCLCVRLSVCLSVYLSVCLSVCLSVSLSLPRATLLFIPIILIISRNNAWLDKRTLAIALNSVNSYLSGSCAPVRSLDKATPGQMDCWVKSMWQLKPNGSSNN